MTSPSHAVGHHLGGGGRLLPAHRWHANVTETTYTTQTYDYTGGDYGAYGTGGTTTTYDYGYGDSAGYGGTARQ